MKAIYFLFIIVTIMFLQKSEYGLYSYKDSHFSETMELKKDNKFIYNVKFNFSEYHIEGNYHVLNDSLILNSYPQKDRIIVFETGKGKLENITFEVKTKSDSYFRYDLHLILSDNKEITATDQWKKSKFKNIKIKGFYIKDKNGLKSPIYYIQGKATNNFKIFFETSRIFENESWGFHSKSLVPRDFNGRLQNYYLLKKD